MSEWQKVKLGDIIALVIDNRGKNPTWAAQGYRALTAKSVKTRKLVNLESIRYVDDEVYKRWMQVEIKKGDILVTSEAPYGEIYYWNSDEKIVLAQRLFGLRIKDDVDSAYVAQYMTTQAFKKEMDARATGTTVLGLRQPELLECKLLLPPLPIQRRIATILSALDDKIELNNRINANLEAQAQALFRSWFVDFEPWGGTMPEGWREGKLEEIAEINPFRRLSKGTLAPCLEMANLSTQSAMPSSYTLAEYAGGMKFQNGDTIMARITPCLENGKAGFVNFLAPGQIGFGSTEYIVLKGKTGIPDELLYFLVRNQGFIAYATQNMNGTSGRQRVSGDVIGQFTLNIAPQTIYDEIAPVLSAFLEKMRDHFFQNTRLAAIRDTLLPKLMSGEIDVSQVEIPA